MCFVASCENVFCFLYSKLTLGQLKTQSTSEMCIKFACGFYFIACNLLQNL